MTGAGCVILILTSNNFTGGPFEACFPAVTPLQKALFALLANTKVPSQAGRRATRLVLDKLLPQTKQNWRARRHQMVSSRHLHIDPSVDICTGLQIFQQAIASSEVENKRALARKVIIERRKEEQERILLEAEREQEEQRIIQARVTEEAELKRRQQEQCAPIPSPAGPSGSQSAPVRNNYPALHCRALQHYSSVWLTYASRMEVLRLCLYHSFCRSGQAQVKLKLIMIVSLRSPDITPE